MQLVLLFLDHLPVYLRRWTILIATVTVLIATTTNQLEGDVIRYAYTTYYLHELFLHSFCMYVYLLVFYSRRIHPIHLDLIRTVTAATMAAENGKGVFDLKIRVCCVACVCLSLRYGNRYFIFRCNRCTQSTVWI